MRLNLNRLSIQAFLLCVVTFIFGCSGNNGNSGNNTSTSMQMGGAVQRSGLELTTATSTLAGRSPTLDGTGASAMFRDPNGVTTDGTNLYIADTNNSIIRKVEISTGVETTLAGTARVTGLTDGTGATAKFCFPYGITSDGANLYVTDLGNNTIRKIVIATGMVTTLAGTGGQGSTDGTGATARFYSPKGITTDATNVYISDYGNHTIRKIVIATGVVTTIAGTAGVPGSTDATGAAARFENPSGVTTDGTNLYVADTNNSTIRKVVIATGVVSTLAGRFQGSSDGIGTSASFTNPGDLTTDGTNLYVSDTWNNTIRKVVIGTGAVTTLAGTAGVGGSTDAIGTAARFVHPQGITYDGTNLYVVDRGLNNIRKILVATGAVATLAGTPSTTDATSAAARFNYPVGVTTDGANLYVADYYNSSIRRIVIATGVVTTLAGTPGKWDSIDATGTAAHFGQLQDITTDGVNLYVVDNSTIRKVVIATGAVTTLAGVAGNYSSVDGVGTVARFAGPIGITTDGTNLYVTDYNAIRKVVIATGVVTTLAGTAGVHGSTDGTGESALFSFPRGITTDGTNLYVADTGNNTIRKIVIATGVVTTLAGTAGAQGSTDATSLSARFYCPRGITTDGTSLYIADTGNNTVRKVVIATGAVTTLAGTAGERGATDATGVAARFEGPMSITTNGKNLYVVEADNNTIRCIK